MSSTRRQEKITRVIRESVSNTIQTKLSDPRINGIVSVTEIEISPDLRAADIYLSIMSPTDSARKRTFEAIVHATKHIQMQLGKVLTTRFCTILTFHEDEKLKKTLETLKLIEEVSQEYKDNDELADEESSDVDDQEIE